MTKTEFRVGGVYLNGHGCACRVVREEGGMLKVAMIDDGGCDYEFAFEFHPATGEYCLSSNLPATSRSLNLHPGELHNVNGQWIDAKPAASIGEALRSKLASLNAPNAAEQEAIWDLLPAAPVPAVTEPERAPLEWNKPTPFDAFKGYEVKSERYTADIYSHGPVHPLQKLHEANPKHGSAHLL